MKLIIFFFISLNYVQNLHGDEIPATASDPAEFSKEYNQNPKPYTKPRTSHYVETDEVKVMIRNINSLLVLDGSEFVVKMAPLLGTATQLWTFKRSAVDPNYIIFTNVANGRVLYSWPYTRSIFCYDWADSVYTRWNLNRDRRLISAAYPKDYLTYGFGNMAISLECGTASDGTDEWILVESKENQVHS